MTTPKKKTEQPAPPEGAEPVETTTAAPSVVDVVAMPSLRADGTPDQTPGHVQLVPDADDPRTP